MAVYFVTGKLGSGKTLAAVGKIRDRLIQGRPVATNLDLKLNKLIGQQAKKARVYRLPDKPTVRDMQAIGSGNDTYDEEKNGLIVLDECGTWFNSRDWQDKDRRPLIDWLLHARKLGWDIIFIIQDISMIDKQARKSVGEFVVYCRRLDKAMKIPFVESLFKFVFSRDFPKAKAHMGIVKYGDQPNSLTVDRWWYMARDLYPAYDTKQAFTDDYPHGIYQVLPPYYSHGRYAVKHDWRFYMRMTRIYLKRFSKVLVLSGGIVSGAAIAALMQPEQVTREQPGESAQTQPEEKATPADAFEVGDITGKMTGEDEEEPETLAEKFDGWVISGVAQDAKGNPFYITLSNGEEIQNLDNLRSAGLITKMVDRCELLLMTEDRKERVRLHTTYCPSSDRPEKPPRMDKSEAYKVWLANVRADQKAIQEATENVERARRLQREYRTD